MTKKKRIPESCPLSSLRCLSVLPLKNLVLCSPVIKSSRISLICPRDFERLRPFLVNRSLVETASHVSFVLKFNHVHLTSNLIISSRQSGKCHSGILLDFFRHTALQWLLLAGSARSAVKFFLVEFLFKKTWATMFLLGNIGDSSFFLIFESRNVWATLVKLRQRWLGYDKTPWATMGFIRQHW